MCNYITLKLACKHWNYWYILDSPDDDEDKSTYDSVSCKSNEHSKRNGGKRCKTKPHDKGSLGGPTIDKNRKLYHCTHSTILY